MDTAGGAQDGVTPSLTISVGLPGRCMISFTSYRWLLELDSLTTTAVPLSIICSPRRIHINSAPAPSWFLSSTNEGLLVLLGLMRILHGPCTRGAASAGRPCAGRVVVLSGLWVICRHNPRLCCLIRQRVRTPQQYQQKPPIGCAS